MRKIFILFFAVLPGIVAYSQQRSFWTPLIETTIGKNLFSDRLRPASYKLFLLQKEDMRANLRSVPSEQIVSAKTSSFIITVPNAEGQPEQYRVVEAPVMDPKLSARYPDIRSYAGVNVLNPANTIRFSVSPEGFYGMLRSRERPTIYISPLDEKENYYMVTSRQDMVNYQRIFECLTKDPGIKSSLKNNNGAETLKADDQKLRTYRLALAASGEFSQFWLEGDEADDAARRAEVLAAQNMLMTRCNGIFEEDFCLRLIIIADNDDIIYLDPGTDPWPGSGYNSQTQTTIDAEIGSGDYDIGHLVDRNHGNSGDAGCIGCVCVNGSKGSGFTSLNGSNWSDDLFVIDFFPHEIGHQLDANHTFSHDNEGPTVAQVEPGSGTTIMGYAGITGATTDVASHSHDNFHAISIKQVMDYIKATACDVETGISNSVPSANAGADFTIPISTPFTLTGSGSDADGGDVLSFVWEQMDIATSFGGQPMTTATSGPVFRCFPPTASPSRTLPSLANILDGSNGNTWERLPSVGRTLNFRMTVRDNRPGGGQNNFDDMVVTVDGAAGPFEVTSPNTNVTWCPGTHTVTWSVNGSDALAANVNILLSTDGGNTFPTVLVANTPNDGTQDVTISCTGSTMARIKIESVGNIFFDISNANFTVGDNIAPTFIVPPNITIYKDADCNYNASTGVTGDVTDEADNCDNTLNATFVDVTFPGSCVGETILTRTWTLTDDCGNATVKVQTITIKDNIPPAFTEPGDITIYKDNNCNHNASVGVTGDVTDEDDNCDNTLNATFSDVTVPGSCIGEVIITRTWSLTDDCGNSTTHDQVITVTDTTRPSFSNVSPVPASLWPPNHKMKNVTINYTVTDNCSDASLITNSLTVTSNEPVNSTGDGNTSPDWEIIDEHHVRLRAERSGNGNGRIYTITITSTDDCGNVGSTTTQVVVAHDNGSQRYIVGEVLMESMEGITVKALPNPSSNNFNITVSSSNSEEKITMKVFDLYGRKMEERNVNNGATIIIGGNYRPGVYLITVMQGTKRKELKLIKISD